MASPTQGNLSAGEDAPAAARTIRRLASRYLLVLAVAAGLVIVDQAIIHPLIARLSWYAPAINLAGRQRMLSQRLCKAALALQTADDDAQRQLRRGELRETLAQWSSANSALREGSQELGIQRIQSPEIEREWGKLSPHFNAMCMAAQEIISDATASDQDRQVAATRTIVEREAVFLTSMERIVKLMENEAASAVARLRLCAAMIGAAVIACLLALGWWVIRPATSTIRRQFEELESRVADRTRELASALAALRREIIQREESEIKTQRLAAQLAHASRVWTMGHLTAGLAHEVNQPLATISNYVEACDVELTRFDDGPLTRRLRHHLDLAKQAALRAGQIVRRMRNFVRPNAPKVADVKIERLIGDVVELCRAEAENSDTEITLDLADEHASVAVDPIQIQQVLVNLVQNSLQAMRDFRIGSKRIEIRTSVADDSVLVEVSDTGPGFDASDSDAVFAPFYTTKRDGLGIGLAICRAIIEDHRGGIWAEVESRNGAKVSFTLPRSEYNVGSDRAQCECVCR